MGQLSHLDYRGSSVGRSCNSLDVAFAARALHLAGNSGAAEAAFEILAKCRTEEAEFIFWSDDDDGGGGGSASIRATALALLMYTDRGEMMADKVARWLNQV